MRFTLKDKNTKEPITVHQAFVKLTNQATAQEIIFVAEPDVSKSYRFDMVSWHIIFISYLDPNVLYSCRTIKFPLLKKEKNYCKIKVMSVK